MAYNYKPQDICALLTAVEKQITGRDDIETIDTSNYVSALQRIASYGKENVMNALSVPLGKTFMAVRPYDAKLLLINAVDMGTLTSRIRKISYYADEPLNSAAWNTELNGEPLYTNLKNGFTGGQNKDNEGNPQSLKSQFEQVVKEPVELHASSFDVWDDGITRYDWQINNAFRSLDEVGDFWGGLMTEKMNDIEDQKEAFNRLTVLNRIAGHIALSKGQDPLIKEGYVDLIALVNEKYGLNASREVILSQYRDLLLKEFVATFKKVSDRMTHRTTAYHWTLEKTDPDTGKTKVILRHTPKDRQRFIALNEFFIDAETSVLPEIFNDDYLKVNQGERVDYWQAFTNPSKISVLPSIINPLTGADEPASEAVVEDYLLGAIYDVDAMMTAYGLEDSGAARENRKHYTTTWWTFKKGAICDYSENMCVFVLGPGVTG